MLKCDYLVEILSPKRLDSDDNRYESSLFAERYYRIVDLGLGISVPDNPMGQPRLSFLEMIELAGLPVKPERVVMNLNTFHTKEELDGLLKKAAELGLKYLLVVRGDGGPSLSKLDPKSIGGAQSIALPRTSFVTLTRHIAESLLLAVHLTITVDCHSN